MFNFLKKKKTNKDYINLSNQYEKKEVEILFLLDDSSGAAGFNTESWTSSRYFLAYVDLKTGTLHKGKGRICWLVTEEEKKQHSTNYPYNFKKNTIYHLRVRKYDKNYIKKEMPTSYYNNFLVTKVVEEDVKNNQLNEILKEYQRPIILTSNAIGDFKLNKQFGCFEGEVNWLNSKTNVTLEVDVDNESSWEITLNHLKTFTDNQDEYDSELKNYSAEKLVELANEWRLELEDDSFEITNDEFVKRMKLCNLVIEPDGSYDAYFNTIDEMFSDHAVVVSGNLETGIENADIG